MLRAGLSLRCSRPGRESLAGLSFLTSRAGRSLRGASSRKSRLSRPGAEDPAVCLGLREAGAALAAPLRCVFFAPLRGAGELVPFFGMVLFLYSVWPL